MDGVKVTVVLSVLRELAEDSYDTNTAVEGVDPLKEKDALA